MIYVYIAIFIFSRSIIFNIFFLFMRFNRQTQELLHHKFLILALNPMSTIREEQAKCTNVFATIKLVTSVKGCNKTTIIVKRCKKHLNLFAFNNLISVSYTHLDVYKRQPQNYELR